MIPLYGFLEGDSMGLLILAEEDDDPWAAFPAAAEIVRQIRRLGG